MTFNVGIGIISTFQNKLRLILRNPIHSRAEYDAVTKSVIYYLSCEGFFMTKTISANMSKFNLIGPDLPDIKNILCQNSVNWEIEVWDNRGVRVCRDNCPV